MAVALIVAGVLSATSLASTESFLLAVRASEQALESIWRFHAAETALIACEQRLIHELERSSRVVISAHLTPDPALDTGPDTRPGSSLHSSLDGSRSISADEMADIRPDAPTPTAPDRFGVLVAEMGQRLEPSRWRRSDAFVATSAGAASTRGTLTHAQLSRSAQRVVVPCLRETWVDRPGVGQVHLLTVRVGPREYANESAQRATKDGPGQATAGETGVWLQSITVSDGVRHRRFWRPIAEPPT